MGGVSGGESTGQMRVLGERLVYDGVELRVGELDLELTDGDVLAWEVVRLARSASVVLDDGRGRVLLARRYRCAAGRWGWELPGGLVDDGEDPARTVARELAELAGLRAGELEVAVSFQPEPHSVDGEHVIFAGRSPGPAGDPLLGADADRWEWVPFESVPRLMAAGQIWAAGTLIGLLAALGPGTLRGTRF